MTPDVLSRNEFLTAHYRTIVWATTRVADRGEDTDDLLGEVCLRVVKSFGTFDPARGAFSTWVVFVARSVYRNMFDRDACQMRDALRTVAGDFALVPGREGEPGVAEADPRLARVHAVLDSLPPKWRAAVVKRFGLDGGGERKLSDINPGCSHQNNRQQLDRGLDLLRELLVA